MDPYDQNTHPRIQVTTNDGLPTCIPRINTTAIYILSLVICNTILQHKNYSPVILMGSSAAISFNNVQHMAIHLPGFCCCWNLNITAVFFLQSKRRAVGPAKPIRIELHLYLLNIIFLAII